MFGEKRRISTVIFILCECFTALTIGLVAHSGRYDRLPMAIATLFMLLLPRLTERLFRVRVVLPLKILMLLYAMGPMLGQCWQLYYTLNWWDKLLHTLGGVMFALVGVLLLKKFSGAKEITPLFAAVFALCFSMAISMAWEFCEFGADQLFGMDMQHDTIVSGVHSYLLGEETGVTGVVENITQVVVDGRVFPGYIDIGLIDTMTDMLLETLGALAVAVWHIATRAKYSAFRPDTHPEGNA